MNPFNDTITVYSEDGIGILIFKEVADKYNLKQGSKLSNAIEREVMIDNATTGISICKLEIAMQETFDLTN